MAESKSFTLITGCDLISDWLKYCLSPFGWLYKFEQGKAKPLPLLVVLAHFTAPISLLCLGFLAATILERFDSTFNEYTLLLQSTFIIRLIKIVRIYRYVAAGATLLIILSQHSSIANVIASNNNFVSEKEQVYYAKLSFTVFIIQSFASCASVIAILIAASQAMHADSTYANLVAPVLVALFFFTFTNLSASLMYTCYLGSSLGKHVENFSKIYIDTMFDQFMKAIEKEGENEGTSIPVRLTFLETNSDDSAEDLRKKRTGCLAHCGACCGLVGIIWRFIVRALVAVFTSLRDIFVRLNERKYPELPEMKMTKLSSTTNIQISETMRMANSHLIRVRLRRTQVMLSELRDIVSDINKTSSPIVLIYLGYETLVIICIATASIQAKVYKSFDLLILPTVSATISLVISVIYICTCLDETTKQLKLLINKLFDFIIMNHRVSSSKKSPSVVSQIQTTDTEVCMIPGSESGAINETWSQFQYTRKLANTIHFTMGGIFPVSRRLVLSILGHILSAVFISIEIMSIIDTQNTPHASHSVNHETRGTQTNVTARLLAKELHIGTGPTYPTP